MGTETNFIYLVHTKLWYKHGWVDDNFDAVFRCHCKKAVLITGRPIIKTIRRLLNPPLGRQVQNKLKEAVCTLEFSTY